MPLLKKEYKLYIWFFMIAGALYFASFQFDGVHQTWIANIGSAFLGAGIMHFLIKMNR